jgi:hypothetical protein
MEEASGTETVGAQRPNQPGRGLNADAGAELARDQSDEDGGRHHCDEACQPKRDE